MIFLKRLIQLKKWKINNNDEEAEDDDEMSDDGPLPPRMSSPNITSFDCNADFDEICCVNESGVVSFVRMAKSGLTHSATIASSMQFFSMY